MKSLGAMVRQLAGMVGTKDLSKWETDFVRNVAHRSDGGEHTAFLTERQIDHIEELYKRHFGDAE